MTHAVAQLNNDYGIARANIMDLYLKNLPQPLYEVTHKYWMAIIEKAQGQQHIFTTNPTISTAMSAAIASSEFIAETCKKDPSLIIELIQSGDLNKLYKAETYREELFKQFKTVIDEQQIMRLLRRFRVREAIRIAWRDIAGWVDLTETVTDLSNLADACVDVTLKVLSKWHIERYGQPTTAQGSPQELVVIAVGKLGALELNFSSDIDLIFCYAEAGVTKLNDVEIDNESFFTLLAQRLMKVLSSLTADGYVFRIDLRLCPFGGSGPIVMNCRALMEYYRQHGRDWERYAMSRARIISGDKQSRQRTKSIINEFVYRRYVDYSAIDALRKLKQIIQRETHDLADDIKRGEGGIREIEFIIQVFQLIRGGKEPWLRQTSLIKLFKLLSEQSILPKQVVKELREAYTFLRTTENHIQELQDQQTHQLPKEELQQIRLAFSMGFKAWDEFIKTLNRHRERVQFHFDNTITEPIPIAQYCDLPAADEKLKALLNIDLIDKEAVTILSELGFDETEPVLDILKRFRETYNFRTMDTIAKQRLSQLLPQTLALVARVEKPIQTLQRMVNLFDAIVRRSVYLVLLLENIKALPHLVELFATSSWFATTITQYPLLLDELIDSETLYAPFSTATLANELRQHLLSIPEDDLEQQMECLRRFKLTQSLRVAAADLKTVLPLMKVSDHLSNTASVIIESAKNIAWQHLVANYGYPCNEQQQTQNRDDFAIIAYGKLGGIEMSYTSDLDLVFLHTDVDTSHMTDGSKPISNAEFYVRLAQRTIHILSTQTSSGLLYAVDTRLRPSGASGMLVSRFSGYAQYQRDKAWTWEHQALVRARIISGSQTMREQFHNVRMEVLCRQREPIQLRQQVLEMREKMRSQAKKPVAGMFDLSQGKGGIIDIEFIVQYMVLQHAYQFPALAEYTDNMRILDAIKKSQLMSEADVSLLANAYQCYRKIMHHKTLQGDMDYILEDELASYRRAVSRLWMEIFKVE